MRTRRTVRAGLPGTKRLVERYGEQILYVRYRLDEERERCWKTIELIVEERPWIPTHRKERDRSLVHVRLLVTEVLLRRAVKLAGGQWEPEKQTWQLTREAARQLGLEARIVLPRRSLPVYTRKHRYR